MDHILGARTHQEAQAQSSLFHHLGAIGLRIDYMPPRRGAQFIASIGRLRLTTGLRRCARSSPTKAVN
jgi:hypothetical protein